jgi:hypothetical protein
MLVEKKKTSVDFYTAEKFDEFYAEVALWAEVFGLTEWRIFVVPRHLEPDVATQCAVNKDVMEATIDMNMEGFSLEQSALYWVLGLLFTSHVETSEDGRDYLTGGGRGSLINRLSSVILKILAGVPVPPVKAPVPPVKAGKK